MKVQFDYFSHCGCRELNEDSIAAAEKNGTYCFILCDGLGGHGNGDRASRMVAEYLKEAFIASESMETFFADAIDGANAALLAEQNKIGAWFSMKTTLTVLVLHNGTFRYGYVGDSRIYHFRKNKVVSRTIDHSVPQMLALAGEIREKQIRCHPDRNRLLRVMGVEWEESRYVLSEPSQIQDGDAFLLCSDGFWEPVTEREMCRCLRRSRSAAQWAESLQALAVKNGKNTDMDNFSAIAIMCGE